MLRFTCSCGQVRVSVAQRPEFLHACNCSLCSRADAWWAYVHPDQVTVEGETIGHTRDDREAPSAELRACPACGTTTHFVLTPSAIAKFGNVQMGVNLRLADETALGGVELRFPDGAAWSGEGAFGYVQPPRTLGG